MSNGARLAITAIVVNDLTGEKQVAEEQVRIYDSDYKFQFSGSEEYKPGLNYSLTLSVTFPDGRPIENVIPKMTVECRAGPMYSRNIISITEDIPLSGHLVVKFIAPKIIYYDIKCDASGIHGSTSANIYKATSLSDKYIELSVSGSEFMVEEEMEFQIASTTKIVDPVVILVAGRGRILESSTLQPSGQTFQNFKIKATQEMSPKAKVIAYYIASNGEVVADEVDFTVDGVFKTELDLSLSSNETSPGSLLNVTVSTHPNAFVGLLAMDKQAFLLKTGNDITADQVLKVLEGHEISREKIQSESYRRPWKRSLCIAIPQRRPNQIKDIFNSGGLHLFTNGRKVEYNFPYHLERRPWPHSPRAKQGLCIERPQVPIHPNMKPALFAPEKTRIYFPETFLWVNGTTEENGFLTVNTIVPDTITSYYITAFAIDKNHGLGLMKYPVFVNIVENNTVERRLSLCQTPRSSSIRTCFFNKLPGITDITLSLYAGAPVVIP